MPDKRRPVEAQVTQRQKNEKIPRGSPTPLSSSKRARALPAEGDLAARIRQKWGNTREQLPLERLEAELGDSPRYDIVAALKELEKQGLGEFSGGKKGHRPSFVWAKGAPVASERRVAVQRPRAAKRPSPRDGTEAAAAPTASARSPLLQHTFHVRPQVVATFQLPEDVTRAEVERLCLLLQAIPFR